MSKVIDLSPWPRDMTSNNWFDMQFADDRVFGRVDMEEPYGVPLTHTDGSVKVSPERVLQVDRMIADLGGTKHNTVVVL